MHENKTKKEKSSEIFLRTISSYCSSDKSRNNVLDFITHESKNIYNVTIFHSQIFLTYKQKIFKELYFLVKQNKITIDNFDESFYQIFDKYCNRYLKIKPFKKYNNDIIYQFIKTNLVNIYLINDNFYAFEWFVIKSLNNSNLLKFSKNYSIEDKHELFYDIVYSILKSIYDKNFMKTRKEILSKKKCSISDEKFIKQIKEEKYLLDFDEPIDYKNSLKKLKIFQNCSKEKEIKSDQNYIARIVYIYYSTKITSDSMCNIIAKAYNALSSFFALR